AQAGRFYAGIGGDVGGIFVTLDGGVTWDQVGDNGATRPDDLIDGNTANIKFAIHNSGGNNILYAGIVNTNRNVAAEPSQLTGLFWSDNQGTSWTAMDLPRTDDVDDADDINGPEGIHPGGQGEIHFSISADVSNPDLVYVGGDRQPTGQLGNPTLPNAVGAEDFSGRLFRGDRSVAPTGGVPSPQWAPLTHSGTLSNSGPHADSRDQAFHPAGLIETDDGGIFLRTNPSGTAGDWISLNGTLQVTEFTNVAYDSNANVIFGGSQDNGATQQPAPGTSIWQQTRTGDGGDVAVDLFTLDDANRSIRYSSSQSLQAFQRQIFDANNNPVGDAELIDVSGLAQFEPQFVTPVEVSSVRPSGADATRIVIAGTFKRDNNGDPILPARIFQSDDRGATFDEVQVPGDFRGVNFVGGPLAVGGRRPDANNPGAFLDNPDVIYAASDNTVFLRSTNGGLLGPTSAIVDADGESAGTIRDVTVDPDDWMIAYAVDRNGLVYQTTNGGADWRDITGNLDDQLAPGAAFNLVSAIVVPEVVVADESRAPRNLLVVGGEFGVYYLASELASNGDPVWNRLGTGLPNSIVFDLDYGTDENGDTLLLAGTLGRGTFTLNLAQGLTTPSLADLFANELNLTVSGVTIVTNGFEPFDVEGDTMLPLAETIRQTVDDTNGDAGAWLLDYDSELGLFDPVDSVLPDAGDMNAAGEVVLLFDWSNDSQHASPGWAESAGDALFAMLANLNFVNPEAGTGTNLHFIGQGMGAVVTSEAVERLAYYNVPVDQVTYLDPHDFDQGLVIDTAQQLDRQAQPARYGAAVWDNVAFADVYYQTRGRNGADVPGTSGKVFICRPPMATNRKRTRPTCSPATRPRRPYPSRSTRSVTPLVERKIRPRVPLPPSTRIRTAGSGRAINSIASSIACSMAAANGSRSARTHHAPPEWANRRTISRAAWRRTISGRKRPDHFWTKTTPTRPTTSSTARPARPTSPACSKTA
ncbi:MAG: hypothetical protein ACC645_15990, partial [Pirellulales bacterium]